MGPIATCKILVELFGGVAVAVSSIMAVACVLPVKHPLINWRMVPIIGAQAGLSAVSVTGVNEAASHLTHVVHSWWGLDVSTALMWTVIAAVVQTIWVDRVHKRLEMAHDLVMEVEDVLRDAAEDDDGGGKEA